jgi:hypothetical protein
MNQYKFSLVLPGVSELTPELSDALYAATKGHIELNMRDGVAFLEFDRAAANLRAAILAAIQDVEAANVGVRVVRVASESVNIIAKINADLPGPYS